MAGRGPAGAGGDLGAAGAAAAAACCGAQAGAALCGALVGAAAERGARGGPRRGRREREERASLLAGVAAADTRVAGSLGALAAALAVGMCALTAEPSWGLCAGLCLAALPWGPGAAGVGGDGSGSEFLMEAGTSAAGEQAPDSPSEPERAVRSPSGSPRAGSAFSFPSFSRRSSSGRTGSSGKADSLEGGVWESGRSLGFAPWEGVDWEWLAGRLRSRGARSWMRVLLAGASVGVALNGLARHKRGSRAFPFLLLWWPGGLDWGVEPPVHTLRGVAAEAVHYIEKLRLR